MQIVISVLDTFASKIAFFFCREVNIIGITFVALAHVAGPRSI